MQAQRDPLLGDLSAMPAGAAPLDLSALAAQSDRMMSQAQAAPGSRTVSGLLVFVSLSMPRSSLQTLVAHAERVQAKLVMRGLKDQSLRKTAEAVKDILGAHRVAWTIDPPAFERFAVTAVPTYVLVDPAHPVIVGCDAGQCAPNADSAYSKLAGDVPLAYALQTMQRDDPPMAHAAQRYLQAWSQSGGRRP